VKTKPKQERDRVAQGKRLRDVVREIPDRKERERECDRERRSERERKEGEGENE
jgi:hypothetical protein